MRTASTSLLIIPLVVLTGCGSFDHIHREDAAATAKEAVADYEAAKLGDSLKGQRAVLLTLEERDVAASGNLTLVERDQKIASLLARSEPPIDPLTKKRGPRTIQHGFAARAIKVVEARMTDLDGDPAVRGAVHRDEAVIRIELAESQQSQKIKARFLSMFPGLKNLPACNVQLAKLTSDTSGATLKLLADEKYDPQRWGEVKVFAQQIGSACADEIRLKEELKVATPAAAGELARAIAEQKSIEDEIAKATKAASTAKANLSRATTQLADVTKTNAANEKLEDYRCEPAKKDEGASAGAAPEGAPVELAVATPLGTAVEEKPNKKTAEGNLCAAIKNLERLGSIGKKKIAEEKIEKITQILQALSGITPEVEKGAELDESVALLAATTRLGHSLRLYRDLGTLPPLEPFIIERQIAEAQLASANAQLALDKKRLVYASESVDAIRDELQKLSIARSELYDARYGGLATRDSVAICDEATYETSRDRAHVNACSSFETLIRSKHFDNGEPPERPAYSAMTAYSESWAARKRQRTAQVRLISIGYQRSLLLREEAIASWKAVLDTPIKLLSQYHLGGMKPSDIAPILQALGIFTVAGRIN